MVSIICKDGAFLAKGTFDFGIVGTYENKEYGEGNIEIRYDLENLLGDLDADYQWMKPLREALCDIPKDADSVAKALENYYNVKEVKVQKNIKQLKDYFLYRLVEDLFECEFPYWEIKGAVRPEDLASHDVDDFEKIYDSDELRNAIVMLRNEFNEKPNDGSVKKTDVEKLARKFFPMFDLDNLIQSLVPNVIVFFGSYIEMEFHDSLGEELFCGACETFDEDLAPREWHNH